MKPDRMNGHYVVVGFGAVGQNVVDQLRRAGKTVVCIDRDPEIFEGYDGTIVVGEAAKTAVLESAGITTATTLVTCAGTDAANAFIILEAKSLNPDLTILARAEHTENVDKLYMAGADFVMPLVTTAARMLIRFAEAPHVTEFVDRLLVGGDLEISDAVVPEGHPLSGKTLEEADLRQRYGISILAIMRDDSVIAPTGDETLKENDSVVFIGKSPAIMKFQRELHKEQ